MRCGRGRGRWRRQWSRRCWRSGTSCAVDDRACQDAGHDACSAPGTTKRARAYNCHRHVTTASKLSSWRGVPTVPAGTLGSRERSEEVPRGAAVLTSATSPTKNPFMSLDANSRS